MLLTFEETIENEPSKFYVKTIQNVLEIRKKNLEKDDRFEKFCFLLFFFLNQYKLS